MNVSTLNLSQSLFQLDEKMMSNQNQQTKQMGEQFVPYLNQSRLSTYYQNNPWPTVSFATKFGLEPLGGPINYTLSPGYQPGNIITNPSPPPQAFQAPSNNLVQPKYSNGLAVPSFMKNWGR